ncbi:8764_t:CDS:2, partial [Cetraspora pellucida]
VLASLNPVFSKITLDTWYSVSDNTNVSEKDKRTFHSIKTHKVSGISCTSHDHDIKKRTLKVKPKLVKKQKKTTNQINIQESDDDNIKNLEDLEVKERLAIKEKEIALNERETELELKKLQ